MRKFLIIQLLAFSTLAAFPQNNWNSPEDALKWLNGKIGSVRSGAMKYNQQISVDFSTSSECNLFVTIEQNDVVNSRANFIFYPELINTSALSPEVKGMFIYLNISTENNLKLIRETVQDIGQSFTNSFRLYFDDIQVARDAVEAIKYIKANLPNYNPYFNNKEDAYEWLGKNIGKANFGSVSVEQSFSFLADQNNKFILNTKEISSKGETKKDYEFYLADFKPEQIRVNANNSRINVTLTSTGDIKPVKYFLNGVQQNYTNKIEIFTDNAQKTFQIRAAFIFLITGNQDAPAQQANKTLDQKIVGLFKKEDATAGEQGEPSTPGGNTNTDAHNVTNTTPTVEDPFLRIGNENIENPEFDNVPMWYDFNSKTLRPFERKRYSTEARATGMYSSENLLFFDNLTSNVTFPAGSVPLFLIRLPSSTLDPYTIIQLNKATINKRLERREFIIKRNGTYKHTSEIETVNLVFQKKEPGIYYFKPEKGLPAGEYFYAQETGQQVHAFSVK